MARQGQSITMLLASAFVVLSLMSLTAAEQCGRQAGGQTCPNNLCCSKWGWCGNTREFCTDECQSQCTGGGGGGGGGGGQSGTGQASFYGPEYVPSACFGFDPNQFPANRHFAAGGDGNPNIWSNGGNCGKYFTIKCQGRGCRGGGAITIKIVDRCPNGCSGGRAFDLSKEAFSAIADPDVGVITVSYSQAFNSEGDAVPWAQQEFITEAGVHMGE